MTSVPFKEEKAVIDNQYCFIASNKMTAEEHKLLVRSI